MLQVKDMRAPETEDDLPTSDVQDRLNPADKYRQIGESPAAVLISSTFATLPSGHACVAIVDLTPKTGDVARAVL